MSARPVSAVLASMLFSAAAAAEPGCPGTIQWDGGGGSTAWTNPVNWNPNLFPTASDDVCIPEVVPGIEVVHSSGAHAVHSVAGTGGLQVSGGTLSFAVGSPGLAQLTLTGGTLSGTGDLSVTGPLAWNGGTMTGSGTTSATNAGVGAGSLTGGRVLQTSGTSTWTGSGELRLGSGGSIHNLGVWNALGNGTVADLGGAGGFQNPAGSIFKKSAGGGTTTIGVPFENAGILSLESGAVSLRGGSVTTGTLQGSTGTSLYFQGGAHAVTAGAGLAVPTVLLESGTLAVAGSYDAAATVSDGTLTFEPTASITNLGTLTINASGSVSLPSAPTRSLTGLNLYGGTLTAKGDLTVSGSQTTLWTAGVMSGSGTTALDFADLGGPGLKVLTEGRILRTTGGVPLSGALQMGSGGGVENLGGWTLWNATLQDLGGAGAFVNRGNVTCYTSTVFGVPVINRSQIATYDSALSFTGGYVQTGGLLDLRDGTLSSASPLQILGGQLWVGNAIQGSLVNGGSLSVTSELLTLDGDYTQTENGLLSIGATARLDVSGDVSLAGVLLTGIDPAPQAGATFTILTAASITGGFSAYYRTFPLLPAGLAWTVHVLPTSVVLEVVAGADADGDRVADAIDCAPADPDSWGVPIEVPLYPTSSKTEWWWPTDTQRWFAGPGTVYDLVRGRTSELPVGGSGEVCLLAGGYNSYDDLSQPEEGSAFYYLVRGRNSCGGGSYGTETGGSPRSTASCP